MPKTFSPVTPLDKAVKAAREGKNKVADFYSLFLRSRIFVPIKDFPGVKPNAQRAVLRGTFSFRVKLLGKRRILMIFDTPMRLQRAFKTPTQFISLGPGALLEALPADHYLLLNAGAPFARMFLPKELAWLRKNMIRKTAPPKRPARRLR
ncbi:MAG TPA: SseB family protein [bacterium]|nr:SseB family protein [bacterium]